MKRLRIGVVGAGRLGGFHAQKLAAMREIELVAIADPCEPARNRVAEACRTEAVADPASLLDRVDAVVIAAPTSVHHSLGLEFLRGGVHVLMEKPICPTADEADELVVAARRAGAVLQVGHVERFNPAFCAALPHVASPRFVDAVRTSPFTFRSMDVGVVLDMMIHDIDLVLSLAKSPVRHVDAIGTAVLASHEDTANVRLEFASGCVAVLNASRVSYETVRRMHVWCPTAFAAVDFGSRALSLVEPCPAVLAGRFDAGTLSSDQVEHAKQHLFDELLPRREERFDATDALALECQDFVESIQIGREPRVTGADGRDAVEVAERILAAIADHKAADRFAPRIATTRGEVKPQWRRREAG